MHENKAMAFERRRDAYLISTDIRRIDLQFVHRYLSEESYWAKGVPLDVVRKSIAHSVCFGVYEAEQQIGFARVVSDCATFAYLADVFIIQAQQGKGLAKWLISCVLSHPELQGLRRWALVTADAHGLYTQSGFRQLAKPERWMELHNPNVYNQ